MNKNFFQVYLVLSFIVSFVYCEEKNMSKNKFTISSPAFSHNTEIPSKYTCEGENISPELQWQNAPAGTKSFALIVDDPDAPHKTFVHWIMYNIPAIITTLPEDTPKNNFTLGATDFSKTKNSPTPYGGPCPPTGTHRYFFTLYALDMHLNLQEGASKEELLQAMKGHILDTAQCIGLYKKRNK